MDPLREIFLRNVAVVNVRNLNSLVGSMNLASWHKDQLSTDILIDVDAIHLQPTGPELSLECLVRDSGPEAAREGIDNVGRMKNVQRQTYQNDPSIFVLELH